MPSAPKAAAGQRPGKAMIQLGPLLRRANNVGQCFGTCNFGDIYMACRVGEKNYDYVVKCEPHGNGPLFTEMLFYISNGKLGDIEQYRQKHDIKSLGMPHIVGYGSAVINEEKQTFIVLPRYGSDVARYFEANGKRLPEGTVYRLTLQIIDIYEYVHSCGYVHADLKGSNLLLERGAEGAAQIYLVGYGLAAQFTLTSFKPDRKKLHNGTIQYTSRDAHRGVATMRGDFEILGYNLIEWLGVELPWVREKILAVPVKVQLAKEAFMANVDTSLKSLFPKKVPVAVSEFIKYIAKLRYNDKPDYKKCRNMFSNALKSLRIPNSGELELAIKHPHKTNDSLQTISEATKRSANLKDSSSTMCRLTTSPTDVRPHFSRNCISSQNKRASLNAKSVSNRVTTGRKTPRASSTRAKYRTPISANSKKKTITDNTVSSPRPELTIVMYSV